MLKRRILSTTLLIMISASMMGCQKEDIKEVKIEENKLSYVEQLEQEEKEHEMKYKKMIQDEISNNSNFENKYSEIKSMYSEYLDSLYLGDKYDGGRLSRTNQTEVNEFLKEEYIEKIKNIETDSESVLNEYKYSLILEIKGSTSNNKDMIENIINEELSNNK